MIGPFQRNCKISNLGLNQLFPNQIPPKNGPDRVGIIPTESHTISTSSRTF
jgi:hypothetical protein